ncbi:MAG: hypothetical protein DRP00_04295 [Candidatus Aenigmatarchaeota archaeon]|nr:MAG: hypothetical protein DRP00_04295 [Candidatus Aenigmarchaeota archaeon]
MHAIILSFDNPDLSRIETISCLKAENVKFREVFMKERVLFVEIESDERGLIRAAKRSATMKEIIEILQILKEDYSFDFSLLKPFLTKFRSFGVRAFVFGRRDVSKREMERKAGDAILKLFPNKRVDLTKPDIWIRVGVVENLSLLGLSMYCSYSKGFNKRDPAKRPFSISSTLTAKLARILVNLSEAKKGSTLLDPFCGAGSIPMEAGLMGIEVIGCELYKKHVYGSKRNLKWINVEPIGLIRCDSVHLPIRRADQIVTDPPYGREAPLGGRDMSQVYKSLFENARAVLKKGNLVFMHPKTFDPGDPKKYGFKEVTSVEMRVHGSLIRVIRVWKRLE